ncbi:MAG: restriction endonuclease [Thiovulaceae bacterium]|nr:restriction endonuclease [Sulfurimonadaceae bacterium]
MDLKKYIIQTPKLHKYFKLDWDVLRTQQYCGILNFENQDFYLLPKIADKDDKINKDDETNLNIFIYMLKYAYDIKLENEDIASCKNDKHTILEVFIQLFAQRLFKEFGRGVYKEYVTEQDNLTTLRGKYLINENLKTNFIKNKIYCEYDELSMNNTLNQFFLYALNSLLPFTKNKKLLKQCELVLDEVESKFFDINTLHVNFNRLNSRFKESFEFALLLLSKSIPLFSKDKKSFAFLFDMNVLFERFIGKIIQEKFDDVDIPKKSRKFGELYLKPDIIVKSKNLIIDCKYKIIKEEKIANRDDRYQMYVYANNFENIKTTMLLYPKHLDDIDKSVVLGSNDNKVELKIKSLDLDFSGTYDDYIEEMKIRIGKII